MLKDLLNNNLRNTDLGLLMLRIAGAGFMLTHGYGKFMKVLGGDFSFGDPLGLGPEVSLILTAFAEFICAIFVLVGFKGRLFSLFLMFTMLVAAFIAHGADPFQKKELALLYFFIYLGIFLMGTGKYSVDGMMKKNQ